MTLACLQMNGDLRVVMMNLSMLGRGAVDAQKENAQIREDDHLDLYIRDFQSYHCWRHYWFYYSAH